MGTRTTTGHIERRVFNPLPQQADFFKWVQHGRGSANIIAGAGCGKTTTILEGCRYMPGRVFIGAFNASISKDIADKVLKMGLSERVDASTMHSAGLKAWRQHSNGRIPQTDQYKCGNILTALCDESLECRKLIRRTGRKSVLSLTSFAKQHAFGVAGSVSLEYNNLDAWVKLCQDYGIDEELKNGDAKDVAMLSVMVFQKSLECIKDAIDFDDQLWAPLYFKAPFRAYDWVMIDEAQDTNPVRRFMSIAMLRPSSGRLVAVGDPFQSCNRFAGADSDALDLIKAAMESVELPLSVTMRCPKAVVAEVKKYNPDVPLVAHENAPEGIVRHLHYRDRGDGSEYLSFDNFTTSDVVLCRNTRPLVDLFFSIIDSSDDHIPVRIEGSSPAQAYIALIESLDCPSLKDLDNDLDNYIRQQSAKWADKNPEKLDRIVDKAETVRTMSARCLRQGAKSIGALTSMISRLFGADYAEKQQAVERRLTLSTIHKAKGKEWDTVYVLGMNQFQPSKYAKKKEDIRQEKNLIYIAQTRTKNELVYLDTCAEDWGHTMGDSIPHTPEGVDEETREAV